MASVKARRWQLTFQTHEQFQPLRVFLEAQCELPAIRYAAVCREIGSETGQPHVHVYVVFANARAFAGVRRWVRAGLGDVSPHIESCKGNDTSNVEYLMKDAEEGDFYEYGERLEQGKRSDLAQVRDLVLAGASMRSIAMEASNYQALRSAQLLLPILQPPRPVDHANHKVIWLWGPAGCGKSRWVHDRYAGSYYKPVTSGTRVWWDGYCGESVVLFDDLRASWFRFSRLLQLLDIYPVRVEFKGGSTQLMATTIVITCDRPPEMLYAEGVGEVAQLTRRVTELVPMGAPPLPPLPAFQYPGLIGGGLGGRSPPSHALSSSAQFAFDLDNLPDLEDFED